ncbi:MAG: hypothetical protein ACLGI6_20810 [Gammaproteobacteria bacterium]
MTDPISLYPPEYLPPSSCTPAPPDGGAGPAAGASSAFWSGALAAGVNVVIGQLAHVDELSSRVAGAARACPVPRVLVSQYETLLQGIAAGWPQRSRPALALTLGALRAFCDSMAGAEGLHLAEAMHGAAVQRERAPEAAALAAALLARLARLRGAFEALGDAFACYSSQLTDAARRLEQDAELVTRRLQADHVQAGVLAQQVAAVGHHLEHGQRNRQHAHGHTPASPLLEAAQRQLTRLRASQAGLIEDAVGMQCMLPALSSYLGAVDRMGAGIRAALEGAQLLHAGLAEVDAAALDAPSVASACALQLRRARPSWAALAMRLAASAELDGHHA